MDHRTFFSSNNRIPIRDLKGQTWRGRAYVKGIVTLKWPYSSSENTSRLQLSEENTDEKGDNRQLIVVMHGQLAEKFVQKIKNNDRIAISREGAELQHSVADATSATGSGWTLNITRSITAVLESCSQATNVSYATPVLFEYSNPWMSGLTLPNRKYTPLKDLDEKSGTVNIAGVVITYKDISQPKDYLSSFVIADPSLNEGLNKIEDINAVDGVRVLMFDRDRNEVPEMHAIGEIVLIRNVAIKEFGMRLQAMSPAYPPDAQCIWTLFTTDESKVIIPPKSEQKIEQIHQLRQAEAQGILTDAQEFHLSVLQAKSPELEDAEIEYVKYLRSWWEFATTSNVETSSADDPQPTRIPLLRWSGRPTIKLSQLQERQFCDFVGHIVSKKGGDGRGNLVLDLIVTDYTSNKRLGLNALRNGNSVEKLDGTTDEVGDALYEHGPQFPFGRRCFNITLWDHNAHSGVVVLNLGDVVLFQNVTPLPHRHNDDGLLYGQIHDNIKHPQKVLFEVLTVDDPRREAIMQARRDHFEMVERVRSSLLKDQFSQPSNVDDDLLERPHNKDKRSRARSEADESFAQAVEWANTPQRLSESVISLYDSPPRKRTKTNYRRQATGRTPISCYYAHLPKAALADILRKPNVPTKFRTEARVVDFQPRNLEDFCVPYCTKCDFTYDHIKYKWCPGCNDSEPGFQHWVWRFAFILEGKEPATVRAIVCDEDAKIFLEGIEPCDLYDTPESLQMLRDRLTGIWGNVEDVLDAEEAPHGPTREWGGFYDWCLKTYEVGEHTHYRVFGTSLRL